MTAPPVPDTAVRRHAYGHAYERGAAYARGGAVRRLEWDEATGTLTAVVDGSRSTPYRCSIRLDPHRADDPILSTSCTCPMVADCKHTVAALLALARTTRTAPPSAAPTAASWRDLLTVPTAAPAGTSLALGVELRLRTPRGHARWAPRSIQTATARGLAAPGADVLLSARPLQRSDATGRWIKGRAGWDTVRRPGSGFNPAQARWLAELYAVAHDGLALSPFADASDWLALDSVASSLLWPHLRSAAQAGVVITATTKGQTVAVARSAEITVEVRRHSGGARALSACVEIDGREWDAAGVHPMGRGGVFCHRVDRGAVTVVLAPADVDDTVATLLRTGGEVIVAAGDVPEFERDGLPRLARRTTLRAGRGVIVPQPAPPVLEVTVRFRPHDVVECSAAWTYAGAPSHPVASAPASDPDRDGAAEDAIRGRVQAACAEHAATVLGARAVLKDLDAAEFAAEALPALDELDGVRVIVRGTRPDYRELHGDPRVTVSTVESTDPDWFDLGILVTIDGHTIPFAPLLTALTRGTRKLLLADGTYFSLAHPALDRLRRQLADAADVVEWEAGPRLSRYQTALWADFEDLADQSDAAVSWRATADALRDVDQVPKTALPHGLHATLRPYQQTGYDWLVFLRSHRLGGILADDMGLGKTLQVLAMIAHARETGERRPFLVVAPTSVLGTWQGEASRFTPELRAAVVDRTRARGRGGVDAAADVVVTSYTLLRLDEDEFTGHEWAGVILDEAQFVKNPATKLHGAVSRLRADTTIAITGTPMENTLAELQALLALTCPGLFPSARRFRQEYIGPIEHGKVPENEEGGPYRAARLARLQRRVRPFLLRRTKELVAADLPAKQEQQLTVELTPAHRALYDTVLQRERQKVLGLLEDLDRNRFIVFRSLTLLRMLALAPALTDPAHARIRSAKLDQLVEQLTDLSAEGHRALVFSQFTSFLRLAADRLDAAGIRYAYLDGSTRRRAAVVDSFRGGDAPVFLISLKAGGFGLTVTEADYVFLLDPWWNPAAESQAVDRVHRIGQHRSVFVYRMIARGTIEEKVVALQNRKARLFRAVLDDGDAFAAQLSADDIRALFQT